MVVAHAPPPPSSRNVTDQPVGVAFRPTGTDTQAKPRLKIAAVAPVLFTNRRKVVEVVAAVAGVTELVVFTAKSSGPKPLATVAPPTTDTLLVKSTVFAAMVVSTFGTVSFTVLLKNDVP